MKTAIITGVSGQDGIYLTRVLLDKGYRVIGTVRNRVSALDKIKPITSNEFTLVEWDLQNEETFSTILRRYKPDEIYNLAAFTSGAAMWDNPVGMTVINALSVVRILEAVRLVNDRIRFCQASSREIFGDAVVSPQNEECSANPRSPYGLAKLYADTMVKFYREKYGLFAVSAILFNHESPIRGREFVTRKITYEAARIKLKLADKLPIGNILAERDWGFAGDYVYAMWLMLQHRSPEDFVLATGKLHSVKDLCEIAFKRLDLNYMDYLVTDRSDFREDEKVILVGDSTKARELLGWRLSLDFEGLVNMMVDSDFKQLASEMRVSNSLI